MQSSVECRVNRTKPMKTRRLLGGQRYTSPCRVHVGVAVRVDRLHAQDSTQAVLGHPEGTHRRANDSRHMSCRVHLHGFPLGWGPWVGVVGRGIRQNFCREVVGALKRYLGKRAGIVRVLGVDCGLAWARESGECMLKWLDWISRPVHHRQKQNEGCPPRKTYIEHTESRLRGDLRARAQALPPQTFFYPRG